MTAQILFCKNDCHRYSSDDMQSDLRAAFKIFDRDRDGFICIEEFKRVGGVWMIIHSFSFHLYRGVQQGKETLKDYLSIFLCRCPRYWAQTCGAKKLRSWWIKLTWWAWKKNNFASICRSVPSFPLFTLTFFSLVQAWLFILTSSFTFTFFSCIIAMFFAQDGNGLLDYEEFVHMLTDLWNLLWKFSIKFTSRKQPYLPKTLKTEYFSLSGIP